MKTSSLKNLYKLVPILALSLVTTLSLSGRVSAASLSLTRNSVVDTGSYYVGDNPGPTWTDLEAGFSSGSIDDSLVMNEVPYPAYYRGWSFNFSSICEQASPTTLTITNHVSGGDQVDPTEDLGTSLALSGQSSLPVMSRSHGTDGALFGIPGEVTLIGDDNNNVVLAIPGGVDVVIEYDVSSLSIADLSNLVDTWMVDPENNSINSPVVSAPIATLTYDDSACATPDPDPTPTTTTTTTTLYCPSPGDTTQVLSADGDCDGDGITNKEEGYDPDGDGNPSTGTPSVDTDGDGTPDYLDTDSDNDKLLDKDEGTKDSDGDGIPDFRDPATKARLAETGENLIPLLSLIVLSLGGGVVVRKVRG